MTAPQHQYDHSIDTASQHHSTSLQVLQFSHFVLQMSVVRVLKLYKAHGQPEFHPVTEQMVREISPR
jgi:hypothetical protein